MIGEKIKPTDGDEVIFKFEHGKWMVHVKYKAGGMSGRFMPFDAFDEAVAALKQTLAIE